MQFNEHSHTDPCVWARLYAGARHRVSGYPDLRRNGRAPVCPGGRGRRVITSAFAPTSAVSRFINSAFSFSQIRKLPRARLVSPAIKRLALLHKENPSVSPSLGQSNFM